ncbi:MAG TPA: ChbG/HpnK family deacetylase [Gemmataceae bacterium]|nr:ChbG/HpnK family deacetylase [Gemmataceae bacterium]
MKAGRLLIVNADDFGQTAGVNRGVIEAHERGIVTSASLMVRWPAAGEAAAYARARPALSLGLHVDLGEWARWSEDWVAVYEVVPLGEEAAVAAEVGRQLGEFRRLTGSDPTHLDSHQHVHRGEPVRSVLTRLACGLGVPVRGCTPSVAYCGDFYGHSRRGEPCPEAITADALAQLLASLPAGLTELSCHPGYGGGPGSMYVAERAAEVRALCDPRVRAAVAGEGIELLSFRDIGGGWWE